MNSWIWIFCTVMVSSIFVQWFLPYFLPQKPLVAMNLLHDCFQQTIVYPDSWNAHPLNRQVETRFVCDGNVLETSIRLHTGQIFFDVPDNFLALGEQRFFIQNQLLLLAANQVLGPGESDEVWEVTDLNNDFWLRIGNATYFKTVHRSVNDAGYKVKIADLLHQV